MAPGDLKTRPTPTETPASVRPSNTRQGSVLARLETGGPNDSAGTEKLAQSPRDGRELCAFSAKLSTMRRRYELALRKRKGSHSRALLYERPASTAIGIFPARRECPAASSHNGWGVRLSRTKTQYGGLFEALEPT